ncbi:hypothetical protein [Moritella sp. F3]|nr:hypothetical protein [Moritella sp. F3]
MATTYYIAGGLSFPTLDLSCQYKYRFRSFKSLAQITKNWEWQA